MTVALTIEPSASDFAFVTTPGLGVVSATARRSSSMSVADAFATATTTFLPALEAMQRLWSAKLCMLAALPPRDVHNVLQKRRGLWGDESFAWARGAPSVDLLVSAKDGERFVGVAELPRSLFARAADHARQDPTALLFLTTAPPLTSERVAALARECLDDWHLDWSAATSRIGHDFECCLRASGNFDDVEVGIDAFLPTATLAALHLTA